MASLLSDAKDDEEATSFLTGAGTTVFPQGVVTGASNTVAATTGLVITASNLFSLEEALPPRFRPRAAFIANRGIMNRIRALDTTNAWLKDEPNSPLAAGIANDVPTSGRTGRSLLGYPVFEASAMQATIVNATKILLLGDFRYYIVVDRVGMNVELVPHLFGATARYPTGQRGLYAYWRNSAKVLSASAFRALTGTT
jgi:HK97 family phage major capsid protein